MWSYSSCTKLQQKYNVFTVFCIGIKVYGTCGQCLIYSESRRFFHKLRLDAISIPDYVIKKGGTHGARHGKTEVQREYYLALNARKRCCKKVDSQGEHFTGIHDRFLRDPVYRESQLAIGWSEQKCKEWDELTNEDHTYHISQKIPRTMLSRFEQIRRTWAYETSIRFSSCCLNEKSSTPRVRRTSCRAYPSRSIQSMAFIFKHIVVGQV